MIGQKDKGTNKDMGIKATRWFQYLLADLA